MNICICMTDRNGEEHLIAGVSEGRLDVLAATELADDLRRLVERLASEGAPAFDEQATGDGLAVVATKVAPGHPLFLDAAASIARGHAHDAALLDESRARAWFHLKTLPVEDEAVRCLLLRALPNFAGEEVTSLLKELDTTAAELEAIDRRLKETVANINETIG